MVLGFKQQFPWGAPTYFREKILAGVGYAVVDYTVEGTPIIQKQHNGERLVGMTFGSKGVTETETLPPWMPKIHTIRAGNRWKAGDLMHMAYGVRSNKYKQFNKGIPELERVVSVQEIEMRWLSIHTKNWDGHGFSTMNIPQVRFGGHKYWYPGYCSQVKDLAQNDGFDNVDDFWKWFSKDFKGQIIHWTDLRYA